MTSQKEMKFQVAVSVLQGIIEAKGGVIAEIVPEVAIEESFRFADKFCEMWEKRYENYVESN